MLTSLNTEPTATSPCLVCQHQPVQSTRAADWPTVEIAGHTVHRGCAEQFTDALDAAADLADPGAIVLRWATDNSCPGEHVLGIWARVGLITDDQVAATNLTRNQDHDALIADYRATLHGAGCEAAVIDIFTGRPTYL